MGGKSWTLIFYVCKPGEIAQLLKARPSFMDHESSNPSDHMVAHNYLWWDLTPSSGMSEDNYNILIYNLIFKRVPGQDPLGQGTKSFYPKEINRNIQMYKHIYYLYHQKSNGLKIILYFYIHQITKIFFLMSSISTSTT